MVGNDERPLNGTFGVYYVLSIEGTEKCHVVVHGAVSADTLEFPSVTPKVPAAVWGEREIRDMFGLRPVGLPDERRLVLPDDWPDDLYPLRKDAMDYRLRPEPTTDTETYKFINDSPIPTTVIPLGPLHITSDEPGHFRLFVDGEDIIDADYRMFYVHRGMEKLAETRMGYNEVTFLADRICGICGYAHSVAYASSVENALGIQVPARAHAIRSVLLETERLHSHLLNLGLACHFVGFDTGFMQFFRVREKAMSSGRTADRIAQDLRHQPDRRRATRHPRRTAPRNTATGQRTACRGPPSGRCPSFDSQLQQPCHRCRHAR